MSTTESEAFCATPLDMPDVRENADTPCDDVFVFPATEAQRRFWLLDQLEPANPALNMPLALRLAGSST